MFGSWMDGGLGGGSIFFNAGDGGSGGGGSGDGGAGDGGSGDGGSGAAAGSGSGDGWTPDQQERINTIMRKEREKSDGKTKEQTRLHLDEINTLRDQKDLSESARSSLDKRAGELETSLMTERERAAKDTERLQAGHAKALGESEAMGNGWRGRFESSTKDTAISLAASKHGAYRAEQIMRIVGPLCEVVELKDEKEQPTGVYAAQIKAMMKDDAGNPEEKVVSPDEYIAWMKTQEDFANLFLSSKPGGTGFRPAESGGGASGANLSPTDNIAAGLRKGQQASKESSGA